jgi:SAM-dependent methyltransferase
MERPSPREGSAARHDCPVYGSSQIRPFMTVADNGHLRRADIALPVHRCASCDIFFLNPPPPAEVGQQYFADAYARAGSNLYYDDSFKERTSRLRLELITGYGVSAGRLLDVGCGKAQFVDVARKGGWDAWGCELDAGACDYARTHYGLETVVNGMMNHPSLPPLFDVITLWDVIEHVPDPVDVLRQMSSRLRPGGIAVVRTANIRSWAFDRRREHWWAFGSDHRFYFSPASLSYAMVRGGLEVVDVVNREPVERPDKGASKDISETPVSEGLAKVGRNPAKLLKAGRYVQNRVRKTLGRWRHGEHYQTTIMTVVGRKPS